MAATPKAVKKTVKPFYSVSLSKIREGEPFYIEYTIFNKTVEAVNSFKSLYLSGRKGTRGGPSTHAQQDLNRAMLVFACAGLDVLAKQLIISKLPRLVDADNAVKAKFKDYVRTQVGKNEKEILNTVALALIDHNPKELLLKEYINSMTGDSLQSVEELRRVTAAAGLDQKALFKSPRHDALKDAFVIRNQIIHEMDITVSDGTARTTGSRTRRQRVTRDMEKSTTEILDFAQDVLKAFQDRFSALKLDVQKALNAKV